MIELLVVIGVIAVLATGVLVASLNQPDKARDAVSLGHIQQIKGAMDLFYSDNNCYPTSNAFLSGEDWKIGTTVYLKKVPKVPVTNSAYSYLSETAGCPQWAIVYAKLTKSQGSLATCKIPDYAKDISCLGTSFKDNNSWGCIAMGQIKCNASAIATGICQTSANCPSGQFCVNGACSDSQPATCQTTGCPSGQICQANGYCAATPSAPPAAGTQLVKDADHDRYYTGGASPQVTTGSQIDSVNGKTYFKTSASEISNPVTAQNPIGPYIFIALVDIIAGNDCNDKSNILYRNIADLVEDKDHDGYYIGSPLNVCVGGTSSVTINGGLVASYSMNEGTGTTLADLSGFNNTAKFGSMFGLSGWWKLAGNLDSSGNNLNISYGTGTATTGPMYGANSTSAIALNGTSDYIIVPNNTLLNPTRQITVSGWFKVNSLAKSWQSLFWKGEPDCTGTNCSSRQYAMWLQSNGQLFATSTSENNIGVGQSVCWGIAGAVSTGTWNYVSLVINSDTGVMSIYLNGVLHATSGSGCDAYSTSGIRTTTGNFLIGANQSWDTFLNGVVADFKVYNRALSSYEIQQAYSTTTNGLVGYWEFDENQGKIAYDSSGNGNNGSIINNLLGFLKLDQGGGNIGYDSSGNGLNATINSSAGSGWAADPSYYFNGTANSYATTGNVGITGDNPWTMSATVVAVGDPPAGQWRAVMTLGGCTTGIRAPIIYRVPGAFIGGFYNGATVGVAIAQNTTFTNITVTYTGNQGAVSLYSNGTFIGSYPAAGLPGTADGQMVNLARDGSGCGSYGNFTGYIKNVQVYNRVLSQSEITNIYANPNGGASWITPGRVGVSGMKFNGTSNYIDVGSPAALNLTGAMSVFMWIKPGNAATMGQMISQVSAAGTGGVFNFELGRIANKLGVNWGNTPLYPSFGHNPGCVSNASLQNGQWYFVGFTRSGSSGNWTCNLYVNPVNGASDRTYTTSINPGTQQPTVIGKAGNLNNFYFNGEIDDVQVYNRALTPTEIAAIYANSNSPIWDTGQAAQPGSAVNLNGVSNLIGAPDNTSLRLGNKQTIAAWVKFNGGGTGYQRIVGKGTNNRNYSMWLLPGNSGAWIYQIWNSTTGGYCGAGETTNPATGWNFLVGTYDGANIKLYRNNTLVSQAPCTITPPVDSSPLNIGGYDNGNVNNTLSGLIDDVKIYKRALSTTDLSTLYTGGTISKTYYKDASGNFTRILSTDTYGSGDTIDTDPLIWAP